MWLLHVRYVAEDEAGPDVSPSELLSSALGDVWGIALAVGVLLGLSVYGFLLTRAPGWGAFRLALRSGLDDYREYVPWILRLSTGIALMGAGLGAYLFLPHWDIVVRGPLAVILLASGFALLLGVGVRIAALLGLGAWGYGFGTQGLDAFMAAETVAALAVLTSISAGRPSVDDLISRTGTSAPRWARPLAGLRWLLSPEPDAYLSQAFQSWIPFLLRVGLGVSLAYAGIAEKWLSPGQALSVVDEYGLAFWFLTPERWVFLVGLMELAIGLALILGAAVRPFSALAFIVLTMTLFSLPDDPVVAHVPLWGLASAVFILGAGPLRLEGHRRSAVPAAV